MKAVRPAKTNAARLLDSLGIVYELRSYEVDPADLTAVSVARKIGLPAKQVFKTLLTESPAREHCFAIIPGDRELDLKKLAAAAQRQGHHPATRQKSILRPQVRPRSTTA